MSEAGHYNFTLMFSLQAPFLIAGSQLPKYGVDVAQIRDVDGNPFIPDSHVKGVLRHAWALFEAENIALSQTADRLFGRMPLKNHDEEGSDAESLDFDDEPGFLVFSDLVANRLPCGRSLTRVSIEDATGAAAEAALVTVEMVADVGELVDFHGNISTYCRSRDEAAALGQDVERVLGAVEAIGRFKTVGFGHVEKIEVGAPQLEAPVPHPPGSERAIEFELAFRLDKRLLVDIRRLDRNTLEGADIIPGTVVKGALARGLKLARKDPRADLLRAAFSKMIISQALPFAPPVNPGDGSLSGAAMLNEVMIEDVPAGIWPPANLDFNRSAALPAFAPDWKDSEPDPKRPTLQTDVRTRVEIDAESGAAKKGALFTQSAIAPYARISATSHQVPVEWRGTIRWPGDVGDAAYPQFLECMKALRQGLHSLGKTNAKTVDLRLTALQSNANAKIVPGTRFVVSLSSPTLMIRERHLANEALYQQALGAYWRGATDGLLAIAEEDEGPVFGSLATSTKPLDFYCQQEFRSGYAALRFAFFGIDRLEPFVLSKSGSVFVLAAADATEAAACLARLQKTGLPVAVWTNEETGLGRLELDASPDFEACPFLPQNGYGAFEVLSQENAK